MRTKFTKAVVVLAGIAAFSSVSAGAAQAAGLEWQKMPNEATCIKWGHFFEDVGKIKAGWECHNMNTDQQWVLAYIPTGS